MFKIKTTQPDWYSVRPWQQVLEKGNYAIIEVHLKENERQNIINNKQIINQVKNRFMVEHMTISDETVRSIANCPPSEKANAFLNIWSKYSSVEKIKSKLNVVFDIKGEKSGSIERDHPSKDEETISAYERLRMENIEKNTQFLEKLGISSVAPVKESKESKVARVKPKVVKATRKLPSRDIPGSYDTVNYQFGDICRGETVQLKDPSRFGIVLKVVKGRRGDTYTVELEDGSIIENLSRTSLWKVLKHNGPTIY